MRVLLSLCVAILISNSVLANPATDQQAQAAAAVVDTNEQIATAHQAASAAEALQEAAMFAIDDSGDCDE